MSTNNIRQIRRGLEIEAISPLQAMQITSRVFNYSQLNITTALFSPILVDSAALGNQRGYYGFVIVGRNSLGFEPGMRGRNRQPLHSNLRINTVGDWYLTIYLGARVLSVTIDNTIGIGIVTNLQVCSNKDALDLKWYNLNINEYNAAITSLSGF